MKNTTDAAVVAKRTTFDGVRVNFHANGEVSFRTHFLRGRLQSDMVWRVAEDVCLYTSAEVPGLLRDIAVGTWRPFRVTVRRDPASAVYRTINLANGGEAWIRIR